jgi:hypothetical protein
MDEIRKVHGGRSRLVNALICSGVAAVMGSSCDETSGPGASESPVPAEAQASGVFASTGSVLQPIPDFFHLYNVYDIGVADFNADGNLDIFSTNCNAPLNLLAGDGQGHFRQMRSEWGLDHMPQFPDFGVWDAVPEMDQPGLYVYFDRRYLCIRTHDAGRLGPMRGRLHMICRENISEVKDVDIDVERRMEPSKLIARTIDFTCGPNSLLRLKPDPFQIDPMSIELDPGVPLANVFVGPWKTPAPSHRIEFRFPDPHSMAWADLDADGRTDVFIGRGAMLSDPELTPRISELQDRLLSNRGTHFEDVIAASGMEKKGSPNRKATWVDANGDQLLDLFLVAARNTPSSLYLRTSPDTLSFEDRAEAAGLGHMPDAAYCWRDLDLDGRQDLAAYQDQKLVIFFGEEPRPSFTRIDLIGAAVPIQVLTADYDRDGDSDLLYVLSDRALALFENQGQRVFQPRALAELGLPDRGLSAGWCDYDNDTRLDLLVLPGGLFRQDSAGRFEAVGILDRLYRAPEPDRIWISWFDFDNDGARDLLTAASFHQKVLDPPPTRPDPLGADAQVAVFKNIAAGHHWLELELTGPAGNRPAIGARAEVTAGGVTQMQQVGESEGAKSGQGHYRLYFGLGNAATVERVVVYWPDGSQKEVENLPADRMHAVAY